jgi:hypothetical protein
MTDHTAVGRILPPGVADLEQLETQVQSRLHGRARHFRLLVRGEGLILTGRARTYYAKQLAQQAVLKATALPVLANDIQVS